jgi:hypothetical protein
LVGRRYLPLADWAKAHRKINPQQLWVNRDNGVVEDYLTPENPPPQSLTMVGLGLRPKPWEVCMTLGEKWAYNPHDIYKSTKTVHGAFSPPTVLGFLRLVQKAAWGWSGRLAESPPTGSAMR